MCLGIPGRIIAMVDGFEGQIALVDVEGAERKVNIGILDEPPTAGDWILIHMGFAMAVVDESAALEALAGLELIGRPRPAPYAEGTR